MIQSDDVILFQGDSITDAGRQRDQQATPNSAGALGDGYAFFAAAHLLADHDPEGKLAIYNRGISGNRVTNLQERWQVDALDLRPTVLSTLIGINDLWHGVAKGTPENGVSIDRFDAVYRELLDATRQALPEVRLVICQPFVTEAGAVLELNFHPEIEERQARVRRIADDYGATFVDFQAALDARQPATPAERLAHDGVHPTPAGHLVLARAWLDAVTG